MNDQNETETGRAIRILLSAKSLLSQDGAWTKGCYARGADGLCTTPTCGYGVSFCVVGACLQSGLSYAELHLMNDRLGAALKTIKNEKIETILGHQFIDRDSVYFFNDDPATTVDDVLTLLDAAIEIARNEP